MEVTLEGWDRVFVVNETGSLPLMQQAGARKIDVGVGRIVTSSSHKH